MLWALEWREMGSESIAQLPTDPLGFCLDWLPPPDAGFSYWNLWMFCLWFWLAPQSTSINEERNEKGRKWWGGGSSIYIHRLLTARCLWHTHPATPLLRLVSFKGFSGSKWVDEPVCACPPSTTANLWSLSPSVGDTSVTLQSLRDNTNCLMTILSTVSLICSKTSPLVNASLSLRVQLRGCST